MLERTRIEKQRRDVSSMEVKREQAWHKRFMAEQKAKSTYMERLMGPSTTTNVVEGKENPEKYESFAIRKMEFTNDDTIWICFPGIGGVQYAEDKPAPVVSGLPAGIPGATDLTPQEGTAFVFHGPTAIAGYTPEQCIKATEDVMAAVEKIVEENPNKKVKIFCFSAGTHLGIYVANQLGKRRGKAVDHLVVLSPGESIAKGIYKTPITEPLADDLYARGITMKEYDEKILSYTQRMNLTYLPAGRNLVVHAGTKDTYIPMDAEGGTNDIIERMRAAGKEPTYIVHKGVDHITLPLAIILQQMAGRDPYRLREPRTVWANEQALENDLLMGKVVDLLKALPDRDLKAIGFLLATRGRGRGKQRWDWSANLSPYEKAIAHGLVRVGACSFDITSDSDGARRSLIVNDEGNTMDPALRARTYIPGTLNKLVMQLKRLEKDESFADSHELNPLETVNIFDEVKRLNLPSDAYFVEISGAMDVTKRDLIALSVTPELYSRLKNAGWKEQRYENGEATLSKDGFYAAAIDDMAPYREHLTTIEGVQILDWKQLDLAYGFGNTPRIVKKAA